MRPVYVAADNIVSPLGNTTAQNMAQLITGISGIKVHNKPAISATPFYASLFNEGDFNNDETYTKFEKLLIASITDALSKFEKAVDNKHTILIVSSTKGNIGLLETEPDRPDLEKRIALHVSARLIADHFGFKHHPLVISNACISGIMGILTGLRLIQSGHYENAVVVGADVITKFILSGFQSFQAVSAEPCKPFDANRTGITLGEGAATIILTADKRYNNGMKVLSGAITNDANHISAPSRTGAELCQAINITLDSAGLKPDDIDMVSAHGTATLYNDEMEAKALSLAKLDHVATNSLKGFYGHTLGAAGLIESVISLQSLKDGIVLPTPGFETLGVSSAINVTTRLIRSPVNNFIKTASGFGGCNGSVLFSK